MSADRCRHADADLVGYAMLRFGDGGLSTWDLGDVVGAGALFVGVLATNVSARGFYAREGFGDFYLEQVHPL